MPLDLACLGKRAWRYLDGFGFLAVVTFKRIDPAASVAADDFYRERAQDDKVYLTWILKGTVDENPRQNKKGPVGAEVSADLIVDLYKLEAEGGSEAGSDYHPLEHDIAHYREIEYDITRIERIHPFGEGEQMGYRVLAKRYR